MGTLVLKPVDAAPKHAGNTGVYVQKVAKAPRVPDFALSANELFRLERIVGRDGVHLYTRGEKAKGY